ncbi:MAG: hypothetical protein JO199_13140 [Candidatus Eremiobacteraeota bacterium]|nr:hypothetical protein [Candidatus Eremiobacteraeota bacterium]
MEGRTRRRLIAPLLGLALLGAAGLPHQDGTFALLGGSQKIASRMTVKQHGLSTTIKVHQFYHDGVTPILKYDPQFTKYMHVVVVSDDFSTFQHLHPDYNLQTGSFSTSFNQTAGHKYYVYADSDPHDLGQQVFRFTLQSDGPEATPHPSLAASATTAQAGPYTVILSETTIKANQPHTFALTVDKDGKAAGDLVPYLGAAAHCVFIGASSLQYVHVHPTLKGQSMPDMSNMSTAEKLEHSINAEAGPHMQMTLPALPAGVYKAWVEFEAGPTIEKYDAPFTIVAQ